ncbi:MAG: hypothetical protein Q4A74_07120 [Cardiobacteriaceae bacterium]|nr:hypothetical protein [Cardiobacteriaceae bacterium]
MNRRHFFIIVAPLCFAACGFHLKGTSLSNSRLQTLSLSIPNEENELANTIRTTLQQQNITISDSAAIHVRISDIDHQRIRTAIGGSGNIREIELYDSFRAEIEENGKVLGNQTFTSRSNIRYRSNTYLGSSQEEIETHQQLARDNADKLVRYLNAVIR